ncbi:MAG: UvrB/UvrC motif-containing protein [Isosphaerales bacterium]
MSQDIERLLNDWEFEPDQLQVRVIVGDDGREKIQMRIDLGVVQMELSGRPDGTRPEGHESLLDFYEAKAKDAIETGTPLSLSPDDCAQLMREGLQYYHRYLSAFHLERYDLVVRDTERNLRLFAFVGRHAARQRDKIEFDRYRPYVQMMYTRALASLSLKAEDHRGALSKIDDGIKAIRRFLREYKQEERETECSELRFLVRWRREVERERPIDLLEKLEHQLELSVALEDYEEAARLRDKIRRLQAPDSR